MKDSRAGRILKYLTSRSDSMVDLLRRLVEMETPSEDAAAQDELLTVLASMYERIGYETLRVPGRTTGGYLYSVPMERRRGAPFQMLLGHCDTVWPHGTIDEMPFTIEGRIARGPGVFDMKAGLVQMFFALKALEELAIEPDVTPVALINADEEIGSRDSTNAIARLARLADRALVLEPALEPVGKLKTSRRGAGKFIVRIRGRSAHSGMDPGSGASAILELAHVIQALHALNEPTIGVSINVGMIEGGIGSNVVAADSSAMVDVRVARKQDAHRIVDQIEALEPTVPGTEIIVEGRFGRDPMEHTPRNRALWERAVEAADALDIEIDEGRSGGVSDANTTSRFTATLDGLGAVGDGAHARHEYADLDRMPERTALLALLLLQPPMRSSASAAVRMSEVEAAG